MVSNDPLLIAHRGESFDAPENTLAAVNLAWERGASAVEVDVHATGDGELAVIHDRDTLRTTGVRLQVNQAPLSALQQLDAGSWKGIAWKEERIPSLTQVLATVPFHGKLVIEIKSGAGMPEKISRAITETGLRPDQVELLSFDFRKLAASKHLMPQHRMLWVIESRRQWSQYARDLHTKAVLRRLGTHGVDGIAIGDSRHMNRRYIRDFIAVGRPVYVWTVNDPDRAAELLEYGVTGIISDRAVWMSEMLKNGNQDKPENT
ncbi:MAG: glycerophosphodiester phosphodiesterase family protein [Cyclonatronaceae bacterium]